MSHLQPYRPPHPADPLRGNPCDSRDPRRFVSPLKGHWGSVGNAVSTELVSLRDKASIVVVAPYGAVTPVEHTSSLYPPVQIRTGRE